MLRSTFIEDLSTLDYLSTATYCTARQRDTNKYFLLSDRLALEIDAKLLNKDGEFIDPACLDFHLKALKELYNPFLPHLYKKADNSFKFKSLRTSNFDIYVDSDQAIYAIHKQYPWIGMNVSAKFKSFIDSRGIAFINKHDEALFQEAWQEAQRESHVPESLRKIIFDKFKEQNDVEVIRQLQADESYYAEAIIRCTLYSEEFVKLKSYADFLSRLKDPMAISKSIQFKPFLDTLHSGMDFNALVTWLVKLNHFASAFKDCFSPRPGLFAAKTPEETKSYILFSELRHKVDLILTAYHFWQRFEINPCTGDGKDTTLKGIRLEN